MKLASTLSTIGLFAMTLFAAAPAFADVVPDPPMNCVDGSIGTTGHCGPYCVPTVCTTDADCDEGKVCKDTDLCTEKVDCGGGYTFTEVTAECAEACPSGSACTIQKVCVTPSSGTTGGSGAGASGAGASGVGGNGGGGKGGSGAGGSGGGGGDILVTGCACDLAGGNVAAGTAGGLLFALGLAGLGGRKRRRS